MTGNRSLETIIGATVQKRHYKALFNMWRNYPDFGANLGRYLTGRGDYPYDVKVRTPCGIVTPRLYTHDDLLTVNEIFCREDYLVGKDIGVVVDLGSNIGLSALYFLTRNRSSRCYLFEPLSQNIERLGKNLSGFGDRYSLSEVAVSDRSGKTGFGIESTGRYGGIGVETGASIEVEVLHVNTVMERVFEQEDFVDLLKIDTEGVEERTVEALDERFLDRIKEIHLESEPKKELLPGIFHQEQYGSVCRLKNKSLG